MSQISKYFVAAFKAEIDKRPRGTKARLAGLVGTTPSHITDILNGRKYGSEETKRALAEALGWNYEELLKYGQCLVEGTNYTHSAPQVKNFDAKSYTPVPFIAGASASALALGAFKGTVVLGAFAPVIGPALGVAAAIGLVGGAALGGIGVLSKKLKSNAQKAADPQHDDLPATLEPLPLLLYKPLLGKHQDSNHLLALPMKGTSMEPTIAEGAIVIVDLADRGFVDGKIFMVVSEGQSPFIARVRQDGDNIFFTSDNPAYPPKILRQKWDDIALGKVIRSEQSHD